MAILKKERIPVCSVEDGYVDRLLRRKSVNIRDELSLMMLYLRYEEKFPTPPQIAKMLHTTEVAIWHAIEALVEIGFLERLEEQSTITE